MDLVDQVYIFGISNIHAFEPNINLIDVCIDIYVMISCTGREVAVFTGLLLHSLRYLTQHGGNCNPMVTQDRHQISSAGGIPLIKLCSLNFN